MRARTTPYTPAGSSIVYPHGDGSVRLLRGYGFGLAPLAARIGQAIGGEQGRVEGSILACVLTLYTLWDDPRVEWHTQADPDGIYGLPDSELILIGRTLATELYGAGAARLGIDGDSLIRNVLPRAAWGAPPEGGV